MLSSSLIISFIYLLSTRSNSK